MGHRMALRRVFEKKKRIDQTEKRSQQSRKKRLRDHRKRVRTNKEERKGARRRQIKTVPPGRRRATTKKTMRSLRIDVYPTKTTVAPEREKVIGQTPEGRKRKNVHQALWSLETSEAKNTDRHHIRTWRTMPKPKRIMGKQTQLQGAGKKTTKVPQNLDNLGLRAT